MRHLFGLVLGAAILWLLLSGHYSVLLLTLGAASILFTVFVSHRLGVDDSEGAPLHLLMRAPRFILWFAGQVAQSNLEVARRIMTPGRAYAPTMARVEPRQPTPLGRAIYANSITLTPGTVTVMMIDGEAQIHALTPAKAAKLGGGAMDRHVHRLVHGAHGDKTKTDSGR